MPPAAWALQDPADSLWRAARAALNERDARRAAELYRRLRTERRFASSEYRAAAYYWEAYAREQVGGTAELRRALEVLGALRRDYPRYDNMVEVERLEARMTAALAAAGDAEAARRRAERLGSATAQCPDQEIRVTVLESLMMTGADQKMPILREVMARRDACSAELREKAVFIISQVRTDEAANILIDAARNDPSPEVRKQAVFWLSQVHSDRALELIEEIIRTQPDGEVLESALFALSQQRSPRAQQLLRSLASRQDVRTDVRKSAIIFMAQRPSAEVTRYLRELYRTTNENELKEAILFALSQVRDDSSPQFLLDVALNAQEPVELRKTALFMAGQHRTLSLDRLGELYRTLPDREMRQQIIFTIGQRRESEAIDRLIEIARNERDVELRKAAIFWLGQSRDPRAVRFLSELISG
jgi:HEAT repeat protein